MKKGWRHRRCGKILASNIRCGSGVFQTAFTLIDMALSIHCPYCHQKTAPLIAKTTYPSEYGGLASTDATYLSPKKDKWWMGICNGCQEVVLVKNNGQLVLPHPLPTPTDANIPEPMRSDLNEAKQCFAVRCFRATATMARRAIQQACIDKGASGQNLVEQIKDLTTKGVITKDVEEWATVVRWVGNDGAHPEKENVGEEDAKDCIELVEQFLHVTYVTPALAKARRTARGK